MCLQRKQPSFPIHLTNTAKTSNLSILTSVFRRQPMNLEMKSIKHSNFASQETYCYQAVVYLDGKPFADVSNDGHGGCDYVHPHDKSPLIKVKGAWSKKFQEIEDLKKNTIIQKNLWAM